MKFVREEWVNLYRYQGDCNKKRDYISNLNFQFHRGANVLRWSQGELLQEKETQKETNETQQKQRVSQDQ